MNEAIRLRKEAAELEKYYKMGYFTPDEYEARRNDLLGRAWLAEHAE